jgi:hypothetical protein
LNDPALDEPKLLNTDIRAGENHINFIKLWKYKPLRHELLQKYKKEAAEQLAQILDQYNKNPMKQMEQDPIIGNAHKLTIAAYKTFLEFLQRRALWKDVLQARKTAFQTLVLLIYHPTEDDLGFKILATEKHYPESPTGVGFLEACVIFSRYVPIEEDLG